MKDTSTVQDELIKALSRSSDDFNNRVTVYRNIRPDAQNLFHLPIFDEDHIVILVIDKREQPPTP